MMMAAFMTMTTVMVVVMMIVGVIVWHEDTRTVVYGHI
jgi:hypothetical protein